MSSVIETKARWQATFDSCVTLADLQNAILRDAKHNPAADGLRSVCWKAFLLFRNLDRSSWSAVSTDARSSYDELKTKFGRPGSRESRAGVTDPLSEAASQPDVIDLQDEELRTEIMQDVERCMPENKFFRQPSTQSIMLEVLLVYCRLNRDIGYRQGMHELVAPLLWVISTDAIANSDAESTGLHDQATHLLDARYIEHDTFALFNLVMQSMRSCYEIGNANEPPMIGMQSYSPIVERSRKIHENYLHHADPELAEHLTSIEILPQIFLIRWIRLLFEREFAFEDVLAIWDVLFAQDASLELVDLICVSMLLRIRWQLLEADYSAALTLLLRYPRPSHPHGPPSFVKDAMYLRDNLHSDGGDHIISKYSGRSPETTVSRKVPIKIRRARTAEVEARQRTTAMSLSPSRLFQDHGSIEHVIQEAAKNVYSQGEKWGVAKAIRGAVQGLQNANTSPQPRRRERTSSPGHEDAGDEVQRLKTRNAHLAALLASATDELWRAQESIDDAYSQQLHESIGKVQYVQLCLANSSVEVENREAASGHQSKETDGDVFDSPTVPGIDGTMETRTMSIHQNRPRTPPSPSRHESVSPARPSLSTSRYAWMLGEDKQSSGYVARGAPSRGEGVKGHDGR